MYRGLAVLLAAVVLLGPAAAAPGLDPMSSRPAAPALRLPGLDGVKHGLQEWRGRVLLVNFWASWCAPCQSEITNLVRWQRHYAERGLQIVGVGMDDDRRLRNVQRSLGINYPVLVAGPGRAALLLADWGNSQRYVPYTVVMDRRGRVVSRQFGELDQETFEEVVLPLL